MAAALDAGGLAACHKTAWVRDGCGDLTHALLWIPAGDLLQAPQRRPAHLSIGMPQRCEEDGRFSQGTQGAIPGEGVVLWERCNDSGGCIFIQFIYL